MATATVTVTTVAAAAAAAAVAAAAVVAVVTLVFCGVVAAPRAVLSYSRALQTRSQSSHVGGASILFCVALLVVRLLL
jgi:hypothetical protein